MLATFNALAEPNRFHIVSLLREKPYSVNELVERLKLGQSLVSKHLRVLGDAGLVQAKPLKQRRIYTLRSAPFEELDTWLAAYKPLWEARFNRLDILLDEMRE